MNAGPLATLLVLGIVASASAQLVTNQPARLKTKVSCYAGRIGSGITDCAINHLPDGTFPGNVSRFTVTSNGREHDLKWSFVGRDSTNDVYRFTFTRTESNDSLLTSTRTREVRFNGTPIVVFEDERHTVVLESPSAADLESAKTREKEIRTRTRD